MNAREAGNDGMTQDCLDVGSVKPCDRCHRASCIESHVQARVWGDRYRILSRNQCRPRFGARTPADAARSLAPEFGVRAALRKAIPRRIGKTRCFGSLQSELRPNQNWPCWGVKWANPGLPAGYEEGRPAWSGEGSWMPFHETCEKGIAPHADTVEPFRNEVVTGTTHSAGFCRWVCEGGAILYRRC